MRTAGEIVLEDPSGVRYLIRGSMKKIVTDKRSGNISLVIASQFNLIKLGLKQVKCDDQGCKPRERRNCDRFTDLKRAFTKFKKECDDFAKLKTQKQIHERYIQWLFEKADDVWERSRKRYERERKESENEKGN